MATGNAHDSRGHDAKRQRKVYPGSTHTHTGAKVPLEPNAATGRNRSSEEEDKLLKLL